LLAARIHVRKKIYVTTYCIGKKRKKHRKIHRSLNKKNAKKNARMGGLSPQNLAIFGPPLAFRQTRQMGDRRPLDPSPNRIKQGFDANLIALRRRLDAALRVNLA
jgi:hypothetical protein